MTAIRFSVPENKRPEELAIADVSTAPLAADQGDGWGWHSLVMKQRPDGSFICLGEYEHPSLDAAKLKAFEQIREHLQVQLDCNEGFELGAGR